MAALTNGSETSETPCQGGAVHTWRLEDLRHPPRVLDFRREPSGGPYMADDPTYCDNGVSDDAGSRFLIALWQDLDAASDVAIDNRVIDRLDEVRENCEMAVALIRTWQAGQH